MATSMTRYNSSPSRVESEVDLATNVSVYYVPDFEHLVAVTAALVAEREFKQWAIELSMTQKWKVWKAGTIRGGDWNVSSCSDGASAWVCWLRLHHSKRYWEKYSNK